MITVAQTHNVAPALARTPVYISKGVPPIPRRTRCFGMFRNGSEHAKSSATNTHDVLIAVLHLRKLEQMLI